MQRSREKFLALLFDTDEQTCFTRSAKGISVSAQPYDNDLFFCINPLDPKYDHNPTREFHSSSTPRRADINVWKYRNFLIEIDSNVELEKQVNYVTSKLPISSIVYSGKKSYHFIISLEEPCKDYEDYMSVSNRIFEIVKLADSTCKNPSRLSRLPGATRPDTNKVQSLKYLGRRISRAELEQKLPKAVRTYTYAERVVSNEAKKLIPIEILQVVKTPDNYLNKYEGRNNYFFWLGSRLKDLNFDLPMRKKYIDKAYNNLKNKSGFHLSEAYHAARIIIR